MICQSITNAAVPVLLIHKCIHLVGAVGFGITYVAHVLVWLICIYEYKSTVEPATKFVVDFAIDVGNCSVFAVLNLFCTIKSHVTEV